MTERHQWINRDGEVLIVKFVGRDGSSYSGPGRNGKQIDLKWPLEVGASVEAPDWVPDGECGGGLHGWPWGFGLGDGKDPDWTSKWLVFGAVPGDVVAIEGKCKARKGIIRHVGTWDSALAFVLEGQMAWIYAHAEGTATGFHGASSATGLQVLPKKAPDFSRGMNWDRPQRN